MTENESIDAFCSLPFAEQKQRAAALGLVKVGDEKRSNPEIALWTCRAIEAGKFNELFLGL